MSLDDSRRRQRDPGLGSTWASEPEMSTWLGRLEKALHKTAASRVGDSAPIAGLRRVTWVLFLCLVVSRNPAARGNRLRAVSRLLSWQVWRRTVGRPVETVAATGARLSFPAWSTIAGVTLATGYHEVTEQLFVNSYVRAGDVVVDVGANVGVYSVPCGVLGACVAAVEPSSQAQRALRHNIALNGLGELVKVFPVALAAHDGSGALTTHLDVANRLEAPGTSAGLETVEVRALDSLLSEVSSWIGEKRIALVKVDCEGYDEDVLRGAAGTIARHRPVVIVESWEGGQGIRSLMAEHGYRVYRFDHRSAELVEFSLSWSGQANFIAVPDDQVAGVADRLAERPPLAPTLPAVRWRVPAAARGR